MSESFDRQLARLRRLADPDPAKPDECWLDEENGDCAALAELLRRWDAIASRLADPALAEVRFDVTDLVHVAVARVRAQMMGPDGA